KKVDEEEEDAPAAKRARSRSEEDEEDEDFDRPRPRKKKKRKVKSGNRTGLVAGLIAGVVLLVGGLGYGVAAFFLEWPPFTPSLSMELRYAPDNATSLHSYRVDKIRKSKYMEEIKKKLPDSPKGEDKEFGLSETDVSRVTMVGFKEETVDIIRLTKAYTGE